MPFPKGGHHSIEAKQKMSLAQSGEHNGFYGRHHTAKTKTLLSQIGKQRQVPEERKQRYRIMFSGQGNPMYGKAGFRGKHHTLEMVKHLKQVAGRPSGFATSEEQKQKLSASCKQFYIQNSEARHACRERMLILYENNPERKKRLSKLMSAENNPRWKGGIANEPYYNFNFAIVAAEVRKRDSYTCQNCGASHCMLHVHHINLNSRDDRLDNLITLCHLCHWGLHYGW